MQLSTQCERNIYAEKNTFIMPFVKATRSSAVTEKPCDARVCLQLVSTVQYLECTLLLPVTSASDKPIHTIKFCSVVFEAFCHKQDPLMHGTALSISRDQQTPPLSDII